MTNRNRILNLGLGLGLCLISGTAFAHGPSETQNPGELTFAQYDLNRDLRITWLEFRAQEIAQADREFASLDRNCDGVLSSYERNEYYDQGQYRIPRRVRWDGVAVDHYYQGVVLSRDAYVNRALHASENFFDRADGNDDRVISPKELLRAQGIAPVNSNLPTYDPRYEAPPVFRPSYRAPHFTRTISRRIGRGI